MSGPNASSGEMPGFPLPRRPTPELDESLLDALLSGSSLPPEAPEHARLLADMLAGLASPASPGALAGETAARSAFARAASPASISPGARRSALARPRSRRAPLTARLAAWLAAAAVGLGGAAAAAYGGVLPGPVQDFAHRVIGAPAAHRPAPRPHAGAARRAGLQLCVAYQRAASNGDSRSVAADIAKLTRAAGGAGKIDGYCAAAHGRAAAAAGHARPEHGELGKANSHVSQLQDKAKPKRTPEPKPTAGPKHRVGPIRPLAAPY